MLKDDKIYPLRIGQEEMKKLATISNYLEDKFNLNLSIREIYKTSISFYYDYIIKQRSKK